MNSPLSSSDKRRVNTPSEEAFLARSVKRNFISAPPSLRVACAAVVHGLADRRTRAFPALAMIATTAALFAPVMGSQTASAQDNTGLLGQYFSLTPPNVNNANPDFATFSALQTHLSTLTPTLVVDNEVTLNFGNAGNGFPGQFSAGAANFESFYSGLLNIAADGLYTFNTSSDDGSMLFIDGKAVVNNNFYQGVTTRTGTITLTAGYHNISVGFYQGTGGYGMNAQISGPNDAVMVDLNTANPNAKLTPDIIMRTLTGADPLALTTGNVITGQDNTDELFSGVLSGIGGVTKWGTGSLTLTGNNTNTGANIIGGGTLIGHTESLRGNIINNAALVFDQTLATPAIGTGTYAGTLSGTGSVTKNNAGTITFTGTNSYTGATNINGGTLAANTAGLGSTSRVTLNGSTLQATADGIRLAAPVTVTGTGTIDTNGNDSSVLGVVSGAGGFVKAGAGVLTLSELYTYTGPTSITGGTLKLKALQAGLYEGHLLGDAFDRVNALPLTEVQLTTVRSESNDAPTFVDNSTWGYTGYINNSSANDVTWTFAENFDDSVLLKIDGVTVLNDTAWNSPTKANYTLTPGRHVIEARFGQGGGGVGPSNQLWLNNGIGFGYDPQGRNQALAENYLRLEDTGDGSLLNIGYGALPSTSPVIMSSNTTLDLTGVKQTIGSLANAAGGATGQSVIIETDPQNNLLKGALTIGNDNSSTTFSGVISGSGTLTKIGTGTQTLAGASTYTGGTTLNAGGLNLNNASAIGAGTLVINGGSIGNTSGGAITLSTNNLQTWAGNFAFTGTSDLNLGNGAVTLTGNRQVTVNSNTLTVAGVISGTGFGLNKAGAGNLILTTPVAYTGNTLVSGGSLK
ncbi:MAG: autotransporter-associated beta strand repeat-containing protein, partial [Verrucomicrobiota bacterium]